MPIYLRTGYRGESGPVQVMEPQAFTDAIDVFLESAELEGFVIDDANAEEINNSKYERRLK